MWVVPPTGYHRANAATGVGMDTVTLGEPLTVEDVVRVAREAARVDLSSDAVRRMQSGREVVERRLGDLRPAYGINTGFGALAEVPIPPEDLDALQWNLVRSHASGVGEPLPAEVVRAAMLLRAAVFATGRSGVRPDLARLLCAMLNAGVHPVVPSRGSVGASGDLAPLAHIALALVGEGMVQVGDEVLPATEGLARAGLQPICLRAKEGLALINGTQVMTGVGCLALLDAEHLAVAADVVGAMTLEAVRGTPDAFDKRVVQARPHPGALASAALLRSLLRDSEVRESHRHGHAKVQDPYSIRCMPQVHGAVRDALGFVRRVLEVEVASATDNPLVFEDGAILSGGNFHGEPVAMAMDLLAIALAEAASISERRVEHLLNPALSDGLTPFLASRSGLTSGLMIAQVAAASLVAENRVLAHPASVDSIPSSANREDHVSMGMTAALKARSVVENTRTVLAIEALCAAVGLDQRLPARPGVGVRAAYDFLRAHIPPLREDRPPAPDIEQVARLLRRGGGLVEAALEACRTALREGI